MELKKLWIPSPFFNSRGNNPLDMIVIHHIGSKDGKIYSVSGAIAWFTDEKTHLNPTTGKIDNPVSAHYLIPREIYKGYDIIQVVKDTDVAFHAGDSKWTVKGIERRYINRYSIGIELEGDGNSFEYTDFQYDKLITLTKQLIATYDIPEENLVGHEDIAPGRKVDPGKLFDWKRYRQTLTTYIPSVVSTPKPAPSPITIIPSVIPDEHFHMGSGTDKTGKPDGFFAVLLKAFLKIFKIS